MKIVLVLVLSFTVACSLPHLKFTDILSKDSRIVNGETATVGQFKWQAFINTQAVERDFKCGGALINNRWILTAAHCFVGLTVRTIQVKLGGLSSDITTPEAGSSIIETSLFHVHELFDPITYENDIALIDLVNEVQPTDTISSIPLGPSVSDGTVVRISGWGKTDDDENTGLSPLLQYVDLTTVDINICVDLYGDLSNNFMCVQGDNQKSTCLGDSGSPVVVQNNGEWLHVGVVDFGHNSGCTTDKPVVYTRTNSFAPWIQNIMNS